MATEKQIPHVSGLLVQHQGILEELSTDELQQAGQRPGEFMKCAVKAWRLHLQQSVKASVKKVVTSFLKIVKSGIHLGLTHSAKTAECFQEGFAYRDNYIDKWMMGQVPAVEGGQVVCYELTEDGHTFFEIAVELLKFSSTLAENVIAKELINCGKTFSLKQVEDLHKRFVAGETEIGFKTNGYANLFFVHDDKGCVFVLVVGLVSGGWYVGVHELGYSFEWDREGRLFSRN